MNKKDYLIDRLRDQAYTIHITTKDTSSAVLVEDVLRFMAILHLCGGEGLLDPRSPQEVGDSIRKYQDQVMNGFSGPWNDDNAKEPQPATD